MTCHDFRFTSYYHMTGDKKHQKTGHQERTIDGLNPHRTCPNLDVRCLAQLVSFCREPAARLFPASAGAQKTTMTFQSFVLMP